jgi:hypothetical protein
MTLCEESMGEWRRGGERMREGVWSVSEAPSYRGEKKCSVQQHFPMHHEPAS